MNLSYYLDSLAHNKIVFEHLLSGLSKEALSWRPTPEKWNLLEIICHLKDEEKEDFKARIQHIFLHPGQAFPPIDPEGWVSSRAYMKADYGEVLTKLLEERDQSILWLKGQVDSPWDNAYNHKHFGQMSGAMLLDNWLAHDYLHIRQINRYRYQLLKKRSSHDLNYAGSF